MKESLAQCEKNKLGFIRLLSVICGIAVVAAVAVVFFLPSVWHTVMLVIIAMLILLHILHYFYGKTKKQLQRCENLTCDGCNASLDGSAYTWKLLCTEVSGGKALNKNAVAVLFDCTCTKCGAVKQFVDEVTVKDKNTADITSLFVKIGNATSKYVGEK